MREVGPQDSGILVTKIDGNWCWKCFDANYDIIIYVYIYIYVYVKDPPRGVAKRKGLVPGGFV